LTRVRVRQHVNPLSKKYQTPIKPPLWTEIYANFHQPLYLDIGCGRGRFLLEMAQLQPEFNFLGIEIRDSLVVEANNISKNLGLTNLYYLFGNVNIEFNLLLASLPLNVLKYITIQFPDPWFKKRHIKRRVVQPELVNNLAIYLVDGGKVLVQSDVEDIAKEMCDRFSEHPNFEKAHQETWLDTNPLPVATEREKATFAKNEPVYRVLFTKV